MPNAAIDVTSPLTPPPANRANDLPPLASSYETTFMKPVVFVKLSLTKLPPTNVRLVTATTEVEYSDSFLRTPAVASVPAK